MATSDPYVRSRSLSRPTTPLRPPSRSSTHHHHYHQSDNITHGFSTSSSTTEGFPDPKTAHSHHYHQNQNHNQSLSSTPHLDLTPLSQLGPSFTDLAASLSDVEANMMHLQLIHESLTRFTENFAGFLYGLNVRAFCVDFGEAPNGKESWQGMKERDDGERDGATDGNEYTSGDMSAITTTDTSLCDQNPSSSHSVVTTPAPARRGSRYPPTTPSRTTSNTARSTTATTSRTGTSRYGYGYGGKGASGRGGRHGKINAADSYGSGSGSRGMNEAGDSGGGRGTSGGSGLARARGRRGK